MTMWFGKACTAWSPRGVRHTSFRRVTSADAFPCSYCFTASWTTSLSLMSELPLKIWRANTSKMKALNLKERNRPLWIRKTWSSRTLSRKLWQLISFPYKSRKMFPMVGRICWSGASSSKLAFAQDKQLGAAQVHQTDGPCRIHILLRTTPGLLARHWCSKAPLIVRPLDVVDHFQKNMIQIQAIPPILHYLL